MAQAGEHAVDCFETSNGFLRRISPSDDDAVDPIWTASGRFTGDTDKIRVPVTITTGVPLPSNRVDVSTIQPHPLRNLIECLAY